MKAARWTEIAAPLATHPKVRAFRQRGMIWAFEVDTDRDDFARWCFAKASRASSCCGRSGAPSISCRRTS
jgi:adenosylmethionine-8-amino-7-oxononanoate aminotransferase